MADCFRMDMSGDKSYCEDALNSAMYVFSENTRSAAVVKACEHTRRDKRSKMHAVSDLVRNVTEVVERLSTPQLTIDATIRVATDLEGVVSEAMMSEFAKQSQRESPRPGRGDQT